MSRLELEENCVLTPGVIDGFIYCYSITTCKAVKPLLIFIAFLREASKAFGTMLPTAAHFRGIDIIDLCPLGNSFHL